MTLPQPQTKQELLELLRTGGDEVVAILRALPPESLARVCYAGGWTGREVVAHLAAIEWTCPRLIDLAKQAAADQTGAGGARGDAKTAAPRPGGIDAYNARQVAKRAGASLDDLVDEFARNRAATIAALEATEEGLLAAPIRSAGGVEGPLGAVIRWVAVDHGHDHVRDISAET